MLLLGALLPLCFWQAAANLLPNRHDFRQNSIAAMSRPSISFSENWHVLGPFQIGTREAAWGADPLEYHGGFSSLRPQDGEKFESSLASNGTVSWSIARVTPRENTDTRSGCSLGIGFPDVDWSLLQTVYGWSALQWQAWVRGEVFVSSDTPVDTALYTDQVLEYVLDGARHFGGDYYANKKAPLVVQLSPGKHVLELRLIRDVRAMGGIGPPEVDVHIEFRQSVAPVELGDDKVLVSDLVDGFLPSPYASVILRNSGVDWIEVIEVAQVVSDTDGPSLLVHFELLKNSHRTVAPGQSRPVALFLRLLEPGVRTPRPQLHFQVRYRMQAHPQTVAFVNCTISMNIRSQYESHKVTHLHPGGIVSYAILRPPINAGICTNALQTTKRPVMLMLHGAGVEADNDMVAHALDSLPDLCAWVLFPTGVTPWSADDWHTWGFADVQAAISNIPSWIEATGWQGVGVDVEKWLVSGHSNGGQGTWYIMLHHPDRVFAAAPVSGYLSIHEYVPYKFWRPVEPRKRAIVEAANNAYRHELLASNAKGIPIQQQHGSADDNVPAYHSRLMSQILAETSWKSNYSEVADQGHWWEGVMTTDALRRFYREHLSPPYGKDELPTSFELVAANPADTGSKFGLKILYSLDPGQLSKIVATRSLANGEWSLRCYNVLAFEWSRGSLSRIVSIDESEEVDWDEQVSRDKDRPVAMWRSDLGNWTTEVLMIHSHKKEAKVLTWWQGPSVLPRRINHLGGLDAILRTAGIFRIVYHGRDALQVALQLSRNFLQYYYADSELIDGSASTSLLQKSGNRLILAVGSSNLSHLCNGSSALSICPTSTSESWMATLSRPGLEKPSKFVPNSIDLGAIFVRPPQDPQDEALELVIWGSTPEMLGQVARLVPLMTGTGQPDFIVMDRTARWRGIEGVALGFFDAKWEVSDAVGFT